MPPMSDSRRERKRPDIHVYEIEAMMTVISPIIGTESLSGMVKLFISSTASMRNRVMKMRCTQISRGEYPWINKRVPNAIHARPFKHSMLITHAGIFPPHRRQRPRCRKYETTGMSSNQRSVLWHERH